MEMRGKYLIFLYDRGAAIEVNESFYALSKRASKEDVSKEQLVDFLIDRYEISQEEAESAVDETIKVWQESKMMEE